MCAFVFLCPWCSFLKASVSLCSQGRGSLFYSKWALASEGFEGCCKCFFGFPFGPPFREDLPKKIHHPSGGRSASGSSSAGLGRRAMMSGDVAKSEAEAQAKGPILGRRPCARMTLPQKHAKTQFAYCSGPSAGWRAMSKQCLWSYSQRGILYRPFADGTTLIMVVLNSTCQIS